MGQLNNNCPIFFNFKGRMDNPKTREEKQIEIILKTYIIMPKLFTCRSCFNFS